MSPFSLTRRGLFPSVRLLPGKTEYPPLLEARKIRLPLTAIGDVRLLRLPALALFCSVKCPGSIILKTYEAMQHLKLQDRVIAGGFHSPMERTCLDILLRGCVRLLVCPARGLGRLRIRPEWRVPLSENRLLIVSPFEDAVRRSTLALAGVRNRFAAELSEALLVPFAARRSRTERFAVDMLAAGKTIYTLPDPEAQSLIDLGASILPL
jgi:predicted Rossmann fold nucleotide-binding protein DprA/Smf involved in DNA uptake